MSRRGIRYHRRKGERDATPVAIDPITALIILKRISMEIVFRPSRFFRRISRRDGMKIALTLMLIRWTVAPATTIRWMYEYESPMLFLPPFGMDEKTYRFYELFLYGPAGFCFTLIIAGVIYTWGRHVYSMRDIRYSKMLEIVAAAFFVPWVPSVLLDYVMITQFGGIPETIVPPHIGVVIWESWLVMLGLRFVYGIPVRRSMFMGFLAGISFIVLGAFLMR